MRLSIADIHLVPGRCPRAGLGLTLTAVAPRIGYHVRLQGRRVTETTPTTRNNQARQKNLAAPGLEQLQLGSELDERRAARRE